MTIAHNLGFPRIGGQRELKKALEAFWQGEIDTKQLMTVGSNLRVQHWKAQQAAGITLIPTGDFAYYDQMLNTTALLGAAPARFGFGDTPLTLDQYFALARGTKDQPAMEMTKWFDTNYHYIVPEFHQDTRFTLDPTWLLTDLDEALALGINAKPVLIGPLTYLYLGKEKQPGFSRLSLLPQLVEAYRELLGMLAARGVNWVQIDEPALTLDLPSAWVDALDTTYRALAENAPRILLATYFDSIATHAERLTSLPLGGIHLDIVRAPAQLQVFLEKLPADQVLSLGIVDGRNVWRCDLNAALDVLTPVHDILGDRLWVGPSCSLLHVPADLTTETTLDDEIKEWLAFAVQKLAEIATLARGLQDGVKTVETELTAANAAQRSRRSSPRIHRPAVKTRLKAVTATDTCRHSPYASRASAQQARFHLPLFPTTTIGSFPQTAEIRHTRATFRRQEITAAAYQEKMRAEIRHVIEIQERIGLDVLVHGEAERNDMVEYFGEQLAGFAFTRNGWVQSYGSRCVKPPLIYGDIDRPQPMTVEWAKYAQSLSTRPVKGMLTGPVTILQWSFVRDDQPRAETAGQIALAIRDEVTDLEHAGIGIIQIDEPAFREGLPLKRQDWNDYLAWATHAFQLCSSGVADETQIHTHMCYSEFNDILPAIAAMDADVITIETSRSDMELLDAFRKFNYPNGIGPGVYDIHSPRVPDTAEMVRLLEKARSVIPAERLWVNPDCGLKTRHWPEVDAALTRMVAAAQQLRQTTTT